ncbi:PREDICTED: solute carrier family 22 member 13-like isoform X1 [Papilio xuthus]|uniref:Solute carrier family 22 member 13-like isoform X1 n=1 Tax=Papilio xuthus TaxID=66420 RepID=A0AAJ6ZH74_PAPXU|nr:PREDICTED: solute carrier family 22 member 13-like isoform X1 [Papilio xuthus]
MKNILSSICPNKEKHKEETSIDSEDYLTKTIGTFGLWQAAVCGATALTRFIVMWNMTAIFFLTPDTEFECIQFKGIGNKTANTCYDDCMKYEYHNQGLQTTLISDYNLICDRQWLASMAQSVLMLGFLVGTFLFGWISDRFGRRNSIVASVLINVIFMLATPFSPNFWTFSIFRLITGIASGGTLIICIVIVMEIISKSHREAASSVLVQPDALAQASLSIFAYYSPNWNIYVLVYSVASIFILIIILFIPESPRWLISRGRIDEAIQIITKAAQRNKLSTENIEAIIKNSAEKLINKKEVVNTTYLDLFKTKELAINTTCIFVAWTVSGTCFFGINQYMTFVGSNLYVAVVVLGLIQMPVSLGSWIINKYLGRRIASLGIFTLGGIVMILLIFAEDYYWPATILGIIGFGAVSSIFTVTYIYASELFPTPLRNMAFGLTSTGAKFGAMVAPFIANLKPQWVPSVVFAGMLFVGALSCLPLQETKGRNLKDTVS